MRFLQLSFLILAFFAAFVLSDSSSSESRESNESDRPKCSYSEVFKCREEATCDNLKTIDIRKVQKICSCVCREGLVRVEGHCVRISQCPSHNFVRRSSTECKDPNEQYQYCGSKCPHRCGDKPGERICTTDCVRGCFCKKGFVLNSANKCVAPGKC
ncbi:SCO-spondin-like [Arctopsyche grandis]|uniref:SCO-spondin-like n=1 Tax=Arctopsyche grandis TaxID=121162 RepID=UPI00406D74C0